MKHNQVAMNIKANGYSSGEFKVLSDEKHLELEKIIDSMFADQSVGKDYSSNAPVMLSLVGVNPRLDSLLNEILANEQIRNVMKEIIGDDYKIWEISARYSLPGDNGLGLHQDAWGQMNLAFAINDQTENEGSTSFLKGSHVLPRWSNYISWARPNIANLLTKPLNLQGADYAFFINKTWHSRRKNRGANIRKILLFGFFPNGAEFKPLYHEDVLKKVDSSNKELIRRLDLSEGVRKLDKGFVKVVSATAPESVPYSVEIEKKLKFSFQTLWVYLQVIVVETLFRPIRILFGIYKYLVKK